MEKVITEIRKKEENKHQFYCDNCNKYLGETQEYEDGYYPKIGEFELSFYLPDGWYKVEKCLCEECKNNYIDKLRDVLKSIGFEADK